MDYVISEYYQNRIRVGCIIRHFSLDSKHMRLNHAKEREQNLVDNCISSPYKVYFLE